MKIVQAELRLEQGQTFERIFFQNDDSVARLKAAYMERYGEMGPSGGTGHSLNHNSGQGMQQNSLTANLEEQSDYAHGGQANVKENKLAQLLLQGLTSNFHLRDYFNVYADRVVHLNSEFVAAYDFKERLKESKNLIARQQIICANTLN